MLRDTPRPSEDEKALRATISGFAPHVLGRRRGLVEIERRRCKYSSSYGADVVTLTFTHGDDFTFFLKDFQDAPVDRREREYFVYDHLINDQDLGTPELFGALWDDDLSRHWLLMEYVPGLAVKYRPFEYWLEAARWIGRMQCRFEAHPITDVLRDRLIVHDREYYEFVLRGALAATAELPGLRDRFERISEGYSKLIRHMEETQITVVHGDYKPIQLIAEDGPGSVRISPVDWEKCAIGSVYYDLATVSEGFADEELDQLIDAYLEETTVSIRDIPRPDLRYSVELFRLHGLLNRARMAGGGNLPPESLTDLVERTCSQADALLKR